MSEKYTNKMVCYTTGAFIKPVQDEHGNYFWAVIEFTDDTFMDGEYVNVHVHADGIDDLLIKEVKA